MNQCPDESMNQWLNAATVPTTAAPVIALAIITSTIAVRARRQVDAKKPRFEASRQRKEELARRFFAAAAEGDAEGLLGLLAADVVAYGDGGGKAPAFPQPVFGRERVTRLLLGGSERARQLRVSSLQPAEINGQPGAVFFDPEGHPVLVVSLDIADDQIQAVRAVSNPDKLSHLRHPSAE